MTFALTQELPILDWLNELTYDLWLQAINKTGARSRFFERLRSITIFLLFPDWHRLLTTLAFAHPPSQAS
jgi:hypothetical protein